MIEPNPFVIQLIELKGKVVGPREPFKIDPNEPCFLSYYDPTFADGLGTVSGTADPERALKFDTFPQALELALTKTPHGKPLRAFTIEFIKLSTAKQRVEQAKRNPVGDKK